jgi:ribA/ribD-fused uncharacterized protein
LWYPTAEHAYQAAKVKDVIMKKKIRDCDTPAEAKDFFETYKVNPDPGWTIVKKLKIMEEILMIKFGGKDPLLTRALLETQDAELIEGNNWNDQFWGVYNNTGENNLGKILMKIRSVLNQQKKGILDQLESGVSNVEIAKGMFIRQRTLYERMIAFRIVNKEYWIS